MTMTAEKKPRAPKVRAPQPFEASAMYVGIIRDALDRLYEVPLSKQSREDVQAIREAAGALLVTFMRDTCRATEDERAASLAALRLLVRGAHE